MQCTNLSRDVGLVKRWLLPVMIRELVCNRAGDFREFIPGKGKRQVVVSLSRWPGPRSLLRVDGATKGPLFNRAQ